MIAAESERTKYLGYCRVSTEEQASQGVSLDAQVAKIRGYADLHELDLVAIETDAGVSAKSLDRPGLARVFAALDRGDARGLIVVKLDRLTRSLSDWSSLIDEYFGEKRDAPLASVSESIDTRTANGRMVLNLLITIAQWEREAIVERTRAAIDHLRSQRKRISGQVPYGTRVGTDGETLEPVPHELATIDRMLALDARGYSATAIGRALDAEGRPPRSERSRWSESTIRGVLAAVKSGSHSSIPLRPTHVEVQTEKH